VAVGRGTPTLLNPLDGAHRGYPVAGLTAAASGGYHALPTGRNRLPRRR